MVHRVKIPFTGFSNSDLDTLAEWCWSQWGGPTPRDHPTGGIKGDGWHVYHSVYGNSDHDAWTNGEFDNEEKATLFKLRWGDESL